MQINLFVDALRIYQKLKTRRERLRERFSLLAGEKRWTCNSLRHNEATDILNLTKGTRDKTDFMYKSNMRKLVDRHNILFVYQILQSDINLI